MTRRGCKEGDGADESETVGSSEGSAAEEMDASAAATDADREKSAKGCGEFSMAVVDFESFATDKRKASTEASLKYCDTDVAVESVKNRRPAEFNNKINPLKTIIEIGKQKEIHDMLHIIEIYDK